MKKIVIFILMIAVFNCSKYEDRQIKMAKEHIEKIGKNPTAQEINDMYVNGQIYYGSNPEMAMLYFNEVVKYKPEASNYLAEYYYEKKDYVNYEKWAEYAAEKGISPATHNFAYYYQQKGDIEKATKYYLIAAKNADKESRNNLIFLYVEKGNDEETKKILKELGEKGDESNLMKRKANYYNMKKEYDKSFEIYRQMIEKGYYDGYAYWGLTLYDIGKRDEAVKIYEEGIKKGNIDSIHFLANVYTKEKNNKEAEKYYMMVVEKNNDYYNKYAMSGVAWCKEQQGDYRAAKEWYQKSVDNGGESQIRKVREMEEKIKLENK